MRGNDDLSVQIKMLPEKQKVCALSTTVQMQNKKSGRNRQILAYLLYLNCDVSTPTTSPYDINVPTAFGDFILKL